MGWGFRLRGGKGGDLGGGNESVGGVVGLGLLLMCLGRRELCSALGGGVCFDAETLETSLWRTWSFDDDGGGLRRWWRWW